MGHEAQTHPQPHFRHPVSRIPYHPVSIALSAPPRYTRRLLVVKSALATPSIPLLGVINIAVRLEAVLRQ